MAITSTISAWVCAVAERRRRDGAGVGTRSALSQVLDGEAENDVPLTSLSPLPRSTRIGDLAACLVSLFAADGSELQHGQRGCRARKKWRHHASDHFRCSMPCTIPRIGRPRESRCQIYQSNTGRSCKQFRRSMKTAFCGAYGGCEGDAADQRLCARIRRSAGLQAR